MTREEADKELREIRKEMSRVARDHRKFSFSILVRYDYEEEGRVMVTAAPIFVGWEVE